jgi:hypothetical protein
MTDKIVDALITLLFLVPLGYVLYLVVSVLIFGAGDACPQNLC